MLICVIPVALAQEAIESPGGDPRRAEFQSLDRNRDGYISRVEALANAEVQKRFAAFDTDKDGRISEAEFAAIKDDVARQALLDAAITAKVKAALLAERGIPSLAISVETYEGAVMLSGLVRSPDIVSRAGRVSAGVSGVRTVHNNIAVK
jgi:osmotically-inducible protein OsmY